MIENDARYNVRPIVDDISICWGDGSTKHAFVKTTTLDKVPVYLVGSDEYFREATESKKIYSSGWEPYAFFAKATIEMLKSIEPKWIPDVIHVNDWHTGFLPVYLKVNYSDDPELGHIATVSTIHNLAYQGEFDFDILAAAGLSSDLFAMDKLECYGRVNFLKAGLVFSDMVNTVSETYACEIQTDEYGCRLDGLLRHIAYQDKLRGIINGIDYTIFDPANDSAIKAAYRRTDTAGKAKCKSALQKEMGLPTKKSVPVIGMVTRLTDQKGLDLIKKAMPKLMKENLQLVILGTGDPVYEKYFTQQSKKYPEKISVTIGFNAALAQRIYAGSDFFLMPSRFEPCGLGQMIALRYGSIPIVRRTGGLGDTIFEFNPAKGNGNGFVFDKYDSKELTSAIDRALAAYADPASWLKIVGNAMRSDYSTKRCAAQYESLYKTAMDRRNTQALAA
jgi:starch synthase